MPSSALIRGFILLALALCTALPATAQVPLPDAITMWDGTYRSHGVTVSVNTFNLITVSGSVTLTIDAATPGSDPDSEVDATTTYAVTVNGSNKKLTGAIDAAYDAGISLDVLLTAPTGGTAIQRTLTTVSQDVVTGITRVAQASLTITYTAAATVSAAPNGAGTSRTVTFTLADM